MVLGEVWKIRRESARFFCDVTASRLRMSAAWWAQAEGQVRSRRAVFKNSTSVRWAATASTISGSPGRQA